VQWAEANAAACYRAAAFPFLSGAHAQSGWGFIVFRPNLAKVAQQAPGEIDLCGLATSQPDSVPEPSQGFRE
jgi:hypothetical protein